KTTCSPALCKVRSAASAAGSLSDREPDARPTLDLVMEDFPRLVDRVAGPQHALNTLIVLRPLLDLVVIAVIRDQRSVSFFLGPIGHAYASASRCTAGAAGFRLGLQPFADDAGALLGPLLPGIELSYFTIRLLMRGTG